MDPNLNTQEPVIKEEVEEIILIDDDDDDDVQEVKPEFIYEVPIEPLYEVRVAAYDASALMEAQAGPSGSVMLEYWKNEPVDDGAVAGCSSWSEEDSMDCDSGIDSGIDSGFDTSSSEYKYFTSDCPNADASEDDQKKFDELFASLSADSLLGLGANKIDLTLDHLSNLDFYKRCNERVDRTEYLQMKFQQSYRDYMIEVLRMKIRRTAAKVARLTKNSRALMLDSTRLADQKLLCTIVPELLDPTRLPNPFFQ